MNHRVHVYYLFGRSMGLLCYAFLVAFGLLCLPRMAASRRRASAPGAATPAPGGRLGGGLAVSAAPGAATSGAAKVACAVVSMRVGVGARLIEEPSSLL